MVTQDHWVLFSSYHSFFHYINENNMSTLFLSFSNYLEKEEIEFNSLSMQIHAPITEQNFEFLGAYKQYICGG